VEVLSRLDSEPTERMGGKEFLGKFRLCLKKSGGVAGGGGLGAWRGKSWEGQVGGSAGEMDLCVGLKKEDLERGWQTFLLWGLGRGSEVLGPRGWGCELGDGKKKGLTGRWGGS